MRQYNIHDNSNAILIVEDSTMVAAVIQAMISKEGYKVIMAGDGLEGLKLATSERPRLIMTDSIMPHMDGYGLFRALKANPLTADIPVIMLSAKASSEDEQRALDFGFIDFISKPIQPVRIISRIKRVLELTKKYRH